MKIEITSDDIRNKTLEEIHSDVSQQLIEHMQEEADFQNDLIKDEAMGL